MQRPAQVLFPGAHHRALPLLQDDGGGALEADRDLPLQDQVQLVLDVPVEGIRFLEVHEVGGMIVHLPQLQMAVGVGEQGREFSDAGLVSHWILPGLQRHRRVLAGRVAVALVAGDLQRFVQPGAGVGRVDDIVQVAPAGRHEGVGELVLVELDQLGALGLVVNIIVLWNTIYMDAVIKQLRKEGYPVRDEDVTRLAPTIHKHINMNGRYSFAIHESVARGEL